MNKTIMNTINPPVCDANDVRLEPVKTILENMDAILKELGAELRRIDDAIYSPENDGCDVTEPRDECLLGTLNRQRDLAASLLRTAVHIREGLW